MTLNITVHLAQSNRKHSVRRKHPRQHQGDRPQLQPLDRRVHQERPQRAKDRSASEHGRNRNHDCPGARDPVPDSPQLVPQRHLRPERGDLEQAVPPLPRCLLQRNPEFELWSDVCLAQTPELKVPGHFGQPCDLHHQGRLQVLGWAGDAEAVKAGQVHQD